MRYFRSLGLIGMAAAGLALSCTTSKAQDGYWENRDLRHDYRKADRLQNDIARDEWQRDQALREGRYGKASHIERDIAHDQRKLDHQLRDIHRDRSEIYRDRDDRDYRRW